VAVGLTTTTYAVDTASLPGGDQSLLRVAASDGFHTAYDQSDGTFSLPRQGPTLLLTHPPDGWSSAPGDWVVLSGQAYDQQYNDLSEEALAWTSDQDGPLGAGEAVEATTLSPGWHTVTLTATDSQGMGGARSVRIFIGYWAWLPLALKGG
jgi:hypothetical protein